MRRQAGLGVGGVVLAGPARFTRADTTCDETAEAWQAMAQAGMAQVGLAQAHLECLMRVPDTLRRLRTKLFSALQMLLSNLPLSLEAAL